MQRNHQLFKFDVACRKVWTTLDLQGATGKDVVQLSFVNAHNSELLYKVPTVILASCLHHRMPPTQSFAQALFWQFPAIKPESPSRPYTWTAALTAMQKTCLLCEKTSLRMFDRLLLA